MQRHTTLLSRVEQQFGVPATLLMAIWTMETDNGTGDVGKLPVIRILATHFFHRTGKDRVCKWSLRRKRPKVRENASHNPNLHCAARVSVV